jgi:regulator of sigma E protease
LGSLSIAQQTYYIVIHELGHFIAAKACNIKVREFSIFMGPKLFQFKRGETLYTFRLIPMGAFVAMEGEEEDSKDERAYCNKPINICIDSSRIKDLHTFTIEAYAQIVCIMRRL